MWDVCLRAYAHRFTHTQTQPLTPPPRQHHQLSSTGRSCCCLAIPMVTGKKASSNSLFIFRSTKKHLTEPFYLQPKVVKRAHYSATMSVFLLFWVDQRGKI